MMGNKEVIALWQNQLKRNLLQKHQLHLQNQQHLQQNQQHLQRKNNYIKMQQKKVTC